MACVRFVISGRVQGVFFRASTQEAARKLGLVGWVRNQSQGSVELLACGAEDELQQLERWLWNGPKFADVSNVKSESAQEAGEVLNDFSVRY